MAEVIAAAGCPPAVLAAQVVLRPRFRGPDGAVRTGRIEVHAGAAADVADFFAYALELGFPFERVVAASEFGFDDDALMAANATSGFNHRTVDGTDTLSHHALGAAFDVNTRLNPYVRPFGVQPPGATWRPGTPGTLDPDHPLVRFLAERGWEWGGGWEIPDYQHFQKPGLGPDQGAQRAAHSDRSTPYTTLS